MTAHNEASINDIAKTVLMPGDPLRAKYIAETYLEDVKLVNKIRNMYAYTGTYKGVRLTVMASGMGMPSIGIYSYELYKFYNVENIIRVGSAGAYTSELNLYDVVLAAVAYSDSTYAKVQGDERDKIGSSNYINNIIIELTSQLEQKLNIGNVHSTDVFYSDVNPDMYYKYKGCLCVEMESFALFYNAQKLNKNAACLLTISDNLVTHEQTTPQERQTAFDDMIKLALEAAIKL